MALTKEKLISRLQTQVGLSKQESRSVVERVLDIMKESLAHGEDLLHRVVGELRRRVPAGRCSVGESRSLRERRLVMVARAHAKPAPVL